jgi:hypothetical protein
LIALEIVMSLVLEVTFLSSLTVLKEFVELEKSSTDSDSLPELNNWPWAFTARRIDGGDLSTGGKQKTLARFFLQILADPCWTVVCRAAFTLVTNVGQRSDVMRTLLQT